MDRRADRNWPLSVARQAAIRIISAPLPASGNCAANAGLTFSPTCTCQPRTVCSEPVEYRLIYGKRPTRVQNLPIGLLVCAQ